MIEVSSECDAEPKSPKGNEFQDCKKQSEQGEQEPEVTSLVLSLHALHGSQRYNTIRLLVHIGQTEVIILVDSGSIHNLDSKLVKRLNLPTEQANALRVMMANRVRLSTQWLCKNV